MDEAEANLRLGEIAELPLAERADPLDALLSDLEDALEETAPADSEPEA